MAADKHYNECNDPEFIFIDSLIVVKIVLFLSGQFLIKEIEQQAEGRDKLEAELDGIEHISHGNECAHKRKKDADQDT